MKHIFLAKHLEDKGFILYDIQKLRVYFESQIAKQRSEQGIDRWEDDGGASYREATDKG